MATETVAKAVYYRRVEFTDSPGQTLQQLLSIALGTQKKIHERIEATDATAKAFKVIGAFSQADGFLCGRLATFERGRYQVVMNDDMDANTIPLDSTEPPKKNGVQQQFVEGVLYFAVRGDHLAIVQSTQLRAGALEGHLAWLLRDKTGLIPTTTGLLLKDVPQKATRERIRKSHVKSVVIGRPLFEKFSDTSVKLKPDGKPPTRFRPITGTIALIKTLFDDKQFEKLGLEDSVWDGNLEVWLEIRYPKHSRKQKPADAMKLLDDLGITLRDIDDGDTKLELADGSTVLGKELRLSSHVEVETAAQGIVEELDMYKQLRAWVAHLIQNDMVSPD